MIEDARSSFSNQQTREKEEEIKSLI